MMLKKKSNNWARLKLALLVPVGFAALSAFARPETSPPPAATMTDNIHLSINKSTVNQETMQQDHVVFLTYKESGSEDLNSLVCKTLDRIRTRGDNSRTPWKLLLIRPSTISRLLIWKQ